MKNYTLEEVYVIAKQNNMVDVLENLLRESTMTEDEIANINK